MKRTMLFLIITICLVYGLGDFVHAENNSISEAAQAVTAVPTKDCGDTEFSIKWPDPEPEVAVLLKEGNDYYSGVSRIADNAKAEEIYWKASGLKAHTEMCDCWYLGLGFKKDYKRALECFKNEDPFITVFMMVKGIGMRPDKAAAVKYIKEEINSGKYAETCRLYDLLNAVENNKPLREIGPDKSKEIWEKASTTSDMVDAAGYAYNRSELLNYAIEYHIKQKLKDKQDNCKRYHNAWLDYGQNDAENYVNAHYQSGTIGRPVYAIRMRKLNELRTAELLLFFNIKSAPEVTENGMKNKQRKFDTVYKKLNKLMFDRDVQIDGYDYDGVEKNINIKNLNNTHMAWLKYCEAAKNMFMDVYGDDPDKKLVELKLTALLTDKRTKAMEAFVKEFKETLDYESKL